MRVVSILPCCSQTLSCVRSPQERPPIAPFQARRHDAPVTPPFSGQPVPIGCLRPVNRAPLSRLIQFLELNPGNPNPHGLPPFALKIEMRNDHMIRLCAMPVNYWWQADEIPCRLHVFAQTNLAGRLQRLFRQESPGAPMRSLGRAPSCSLLALQLSDCHHEIGVDGDAYVSRCVDVVTRLWLTPRPASRSRAVIRR